MVLFGGANPKNTQVAKGRLRLSMPSAGWIEELVRARASRVVNVSPIRDDGPGSVAPEWIAIRPNTDTAMMLALTHTLVAEGLHDRAVPGEPLRRVRARPALSHGRERRAAQGCRLGGGDHRGAGRHDPRARPPHGGARTMLTASWSIQRADHGEQPYWALVLLAAALGQIGLPGGGFGFGYGSSANIAEPPLLFPARRWR